MYLVEAAKNLIQPDSAWISNKETKCNKGKFITESFYFLYSEKSLYFYYKSVHLTGQTALLKLPAKA